MIYYMYLKLYIAYTCVYIEYINACSILFMFLLWVKKEQKHE